MEKQLDVFGDGKTMVPVIADKDGVIQTDSVPVEVTKSCGCTHKRYDVKGKIVVWTLSGNDMCQACKDKQAAEALKAAERQVEQTKMAIIDLEIKKAQAVKSGYTDIADKYDANIIELQAKLPK